LSDQTESHAASERSRAFDNEPEWKEIRRMKPALLVLAAGIGSRYGGLKQIDPVGPAGERIVEYSVYDALRAGFGKVVFVIRHDIEKDFRKAIGDPFGGRINVEYAFQELAPLPEGFSVPAGRVKPWGTAHAILAARDHIHEPFAVINADDFYGAGGYRALHDHLAVPAREPRYALVGFVLRNTLSDHGSVARGVCRVSGAGHLREVTEYLTIGKAGRGAADAATGVRFSGDEYVSMNMWGFDPGLFSVLQEKFVAFLRDQIAAPKSEFLLPAVVNEQIQSAGARVRVLPTSDSWLGMTYAGDKPRVVASIARLVADGVYPTPLWKR
jgi:hypothetical protein